MTWTPTMDPDLEVRKARPRVVKYLQGIGLDLGGGEEPVTSNALVVDLGTPKATFKVDLGSPGALKIFADGSMDFLFSAFTLNEIGDPIGALEEWWRVLKPGGRLVLYLPHKALYPKAGSKDANPRHKLDLEGSDVLGILDSIGGYQVLENTICDEGNEYAFLLAVRKVVGIGAGVLPSKPDTDTRKRAGVYRAGGYGDVIAALPVLRELKRQGYHVTFITQEQGMEIVRHEPSIDEIVQLFEDQIDPYLLGDFWARLEKHFDRFINLSLTMERSLLFRGPGGKHLEERDEAQDPEYDLPYAERHRIANRNYSEFAHEKAGLPNLSPVPQPIFLTEMEKRMGSLMRQDNQDNFLVQITLSGSSDHKIFLMAHEFCARFLEACPQARVITAGNKEAQFMEWKQRGVVNKCGIMPFRSSAIVASIADLVVTPETGLAWAAAGFGTRQIVLLSHSSEENLTKHWPNTTSLVPPVPCHPCHQIHNRSTDCPSDSVQFAKLPKASGMPICTTRMGVEAILRPAMEAYQDWLLKRAEPEIVSRNGHLVPA